jgi:hypothetical protein
MVSNPASCHDAGRARSADLERRNRLGRARATGSSAPAGRAPSDDAAPGWGNLERMWKQAGVVALLVAVVVGGCGDSDSGGNEWSSSEHVPDASVEPIEGDYSAGMWVVYMDTEGQLCGASGATRSVDPTSGVCGTTDDLAITLHDADGKPIVLYGAVPDGTEGISTPDAQESWTSWTATESPDGGLIYAIMLSSEPIPTEIVFWNKEGEVIETARVDR